MRNLLAARFPGWGRRAVSLVVVSWSSFAQPVEGGPDVALPVDRERLPRLVLQSAHVRDGAGHHDDVVRLVAVQEAGRHSRISSVRDLRLNGAQAIGRLG